MEQGSGARGKHSRALHAGSGAPRKQLWTCWTAIKCDGDVSELPAKTLMPLSTHAQGGVSFSQTLSKDLLLQNRSDQ